jgi:hypothetical protein
VTLQDGGGTETGNAGSNHHCPLLWSWSWVAIWSIRDGRWHLSHSGVDDGRDREIRRALTQNQAKTFGGFFRTTTVSQRGHAILLSHS